jgi:hypothetical protein
MLATRGGFDDSDVHAIVLPPPHYVTGEDFLQTPSLDFVGAQEPAFAVSTTTKKVACRGRTSSSGM